MTLSWARHALHRHRTARRDHARVMAALAEVQRLRGIVQDRLNRALAALAERDEWIHDDQYRARQWETWRAARAHADRAKEQR